MNINKLDQSITDLVFFFFVNLKSFKMNLISTQAAYNYYYVYRFSYEI